MQSQVIDANVPQYAAKEIICAAQQTVLRSPLERRASKKWTYHFLLYYDFYTTLTALHHRNQENIGEVNNLYFYYNVDVKSNIQLLRMKWDLYFFNDYGVRHFFDSITTKTQDQFTLKNNIYYPIWRNKIFLSLQANTQTKLFNTYRYHQPNGQRYLYDGFMSPGVIYYSGGITFECRGNTNIQLGLGSSKVTKIRNQKIFETRETDRIQGINKGQKKREELGLTLSVLVPTQALGKRWHWEMTGNLFAPMDQLKEIRYYTMDMNNVFHFCFLRYVRLSLRTKIKYDMEEGKKMGISNQISLGFYLNNHL